MIRPINIYSISRIHDSDVFSAVERLQSQKEDEKRTQYHEIESLRLLVDSLIRHGVRIEDFDGFFFGFTIPRIGKEFDLLKISNDQILNIELKSTCVGGNQILAQLLKNKHYLNHLGRKKIIYSIVTDRMLCYKLSLKDELVEVSFEEVVTTFKSLAKEYITNIEQLFKASQYLVSPINTPVKFIQGKYFLTQAQEFIKRELLNTIEDLKLGRAKFHIMGRPGTGKTLLLYDIAKTLSKSGMTAILHCGKLVGGQRKIGAEIHNLDVVAADNLKNDDFDLSKYKYILIDEAHRLDENQFGKICCFAKRNLQVCMFFSDPEQVLSVAEKNRDIVGKIRCNDLTKEFVLSEKIRANKEINSFILNVKNLNHRPKVSVNYANIQLNYANTTQEAQNLLGYYKNKGYVFINYSKSTHGTSPYDAYNEDFDNLHVIGQEFDKVVMLMDDCFYYDDNGELQNNANSNADYLYQNLFYQGVTRVRDELAIVIVSAPKLFEQITSIIK